MFFQCAPDPEDVIAQRRLPDGRVLAVFRNDREVRAEARDEARAAEVIAGQVIVAMRYTRRVYSRVTERVYSLVVTDDTALPEKWRALATRRSEASALKLFKNFREGDDDRRRRQVEGSPRRRSTDGERP